jgi:hypothetical protein
MTYFNSTQFYEIEQSKNKTKVKIAHHYNIKNLKLKMINKI